jgi:hypothetical protein
MAGHDHSTTIPRHNTYTCTHSHARKSNPPGDASENLELASVLATSKLLGMMENNEETRQKPEAPYQSKKRTRGVSKQQQLTLVRGRHIPRVDSQSERVGAR